MRTEAFVAVEGLCEQFFYGLEETDLAWRLIDQGWSVRFRADLRLLHPRTDPARHGDFHRNTARNRVWLAHRALPFPLAVFYVLNWSLVTAMRNITRPSGIAAHAGGTIDGWKHRFGPRRPMSWRTVLRLARLGRPPLI